MSSDGADNDMVGGANTNVILLGVYWLGIIIADRCDDPITNVVCKYFLDGDPDDGDDA